VEHQETVDAAMEGRKSTFNRLSVCHHRFNFQLSEREREIASCVGMGRDKAIALMSEYDRWDKCAVCFEEWQSHLGYLCPSGDSTFVKLVKSKLPYLHNA
jgi:hypothetical protein